MTERYISTPIINIKISKTININNLPNPTFHKNTGF